METNKIFNIDCVEGMRKIPDNYIDMTVTSPPYDNLRKYKGFSWNFEETAKELYRITKQGGVVVWIVGDATVKGNETGTSFKQALYFKECGFNLHDTMIYEKAQACFGSTLCYLQAFEYMFIFSKGKPKTINFLRDRKNQRSGVESMGTRGLTEDGKKSGRHYKELKEYGKRKNIWIYGVGGGKIDHPAVFPKQLAKDHILSWSNERDIVLDPFMGSGTTAVACIETNRNFIGFEIAREYCEIAEKRIQEAAQ